MIRFTGCIESNRTAREHDDFGAGGCALVEVYHIFVAHADAAGGHVVADAFRLIGAVDAIERVDLALPEVERAGAERIVGAAMHAVTASQLDHVLADFGFAIENILGWIPVRPFACRGQWRWPGRPNPPLPPPPSFCPPPPPPFPP